MTARRPSDADAYDVLIVGGGPAGLSAALALGRAAKRVLVSDAGTRRNAAAEHMHGFITRDGTTPAEFRRIAREQLRPYDVSLRDIGVRHIARGPDGGFAITLADGAEARCRRVLLASGLLDELPDLAGVRELWGTSIFACPYCHGWEARDQRWGVLAISDELMEHAVFIRGWTERVLALTNGATPSPPQLQRLVAAGVRVESRPLRRVVSGPDRRLVAVETVDGDRVLLDVLVVRPRQRQIRLVTELGLELDERGFVRVDEHGGTSVAGIHAAGDLAAPMQAAVFAAAAGTRVAYAMNHAMNIERFAQASA